MRNIVSTRTAHIRHLMGILAVALPSACSESDSGSGSGKLGGADASGPIGTEAGTDVPEASSRPGEPNDADSYPIDPNGPPPDCILPCVWEAMKRCPGPQPGQACVYDGSRQSYCCPIDGPVPDEPVLCEDDRWVASKVDSVVYEEGNLCWVRKGTASMAAPGPPLRPADWTSTWYVPDETTGELSRIATLEHSDPVFKNGIVGEGACYDGDEIVFTAYLDFRAEHCREWYPHCDVPGICPLFPGLDDTNDASTGTMTDGGGAGSSAIDGSLISSDAASSSSDGAAIPDAMGDAADTD